MRSSTTVLPPAQNDPHAVINCRRFASADDLRYDCSVAEPTVCASACLDHLALKISLVAGPIAKTAAKTMRGHASVEPTKQINIEFLLSGFSGRSPAKTKRLIRRS